MTYIKSEGVAAGINALDHELYLELMVIRSELQNFDRSTQDPAVAPRELAALVRRFAYANLLSAGPEESLMARALIHACLARLAPFQQAAPVRRQGPMPSPDERWLLAPIGWASTQLEAALDAWTKARPIRRGLVLLIPTTSLRIVDVKYPLSPDRSARQVSGSGLLALDAPVMLVGGGRAGPAIEAAIRSAMA